MQFLWACTLVASILAALVLGAVLVSATGAPQQAAGAAVALCVAAIPYIFTRAIEGIGQASWRREMLKEARRQT